MRILFTLLILCFFFNAQGTHLNGSQLTYEHLGGLVYRFNVKIYHDCGSLTNPPSTAPIIAKSVSLGITKNFNLPLQSINEVNHYCSNIITNCTAITGYTGIRLYTYEGTCLLDSLGLAYANDWTFSLSLCCRNDLILNMPNPATHNLYNMCTHNNLNYPNNHSVKYNSSSAVIFPINTVINTNPGFYDLDGDSLYIEVDSPMSNNAMSIGYFPPCNLANPFGPSNSFSINNQTGDLTFQINTVGLYVLTLKVSEYRNGNLIATSYRDLNYYIIPGTTPNLYPTLSGVNNTSSYIANATANNNMTFNINSADLNTGDSTFITWDSIPPGVTVNLNANQNQMATLSWTPTVADVSPYPYLITFHVKDNHCDVVGQSAKSFLIYVNQNATDSVWAGDANADYVVNSADVLNIGLGYGSSGSIRPSATTNWQAEYCPNWLNSFNSGINYKHADCNGDGSIDFNDTTAISLNYGQVHLKESNVQPMNVLNNPDLFFETNGITAYNGNVLQVPIHFGNATNALSNVYGIAGTIEIVNASVASPISLTANTCWLGNTSNSLLFNKSISSQKVDFALVRKDHNNQNGYGEILNLKIPLSSSNVIGSTVQLNLNNIYAIDKNGNNIMPFNIVNNSIIIQNPSDINNVDYSTIQIYPNPTTNKCQVKMNTLQQNQLQSIAVTNICGALVKNQSQEELSKKSYTIDVNNMQPGVYMLKLIFKDGSTHNKKIIKQ